MFPSGQKEEDAATMGSLHLVPLLASLQLLLRPGSPEGAAPPPAAPAPAAPNMSATPAKAEYLAGDAVTLRCAAPPSARGILAFHFRSAAGWAAEVRTARRSAAYGFNVTGPRDAGPLACAYSVAGPRRQRLRSPDSAPLGLRVRAPPPAPALALSPASGVTLVGEPLELRCAAPDGGGAAAPPRRFRFYGEREELGPAQAAPLLRLVATPGELGGEVSCAYEEQTEGRWLASPRSPAHRVLVTELPPPPALLSDPPSGAVPEGSPLLLTCAAAVTAAAPRRFLFYRDGAEQFAAAAAARDRAHFSVAAASARFTCRYEEKVGDTWVPSPTSAALTVVTPARPPLVPLVAGCAAGGAVLLLVLLLVACLRRRWRGGVHWKGLRDRDEAGAYAMANVYGGEG